MGPCMCGDICCSSCGPAQGNHHCPYCGSWTMDGGCADPAKCKTADDQYCEAVAAEAKWEADHADEIAQLFDYP